MQCYISVVCALSVLIALSSAAPAPQQSNQGSFGFNAGGSLNTTALVSTFNQKVQLLRRFCPQLFQVIDNVVQNITSQLFSVVGRVILRNGLGGGGSGGSGSTVESRVSVVLPTFPPDEDDYDDEENSDSTTSGGLDIRIVNSRTSTTQSSNEIPLIANDVETEEAPFTADKKLENRIGENVVDQSVAEHFDDCGDLFETYTSHEKLVAPTSTGSANFDIANRNSFAENGANIAEYTATTTEIENMLDATVATSDDSTKLSLRDPKLNSVDAIFKGVIEVQNTEEFGGNTEAETSSNKDSEMVTFKESQEEVTTTETSARFDIKVVQNGNVVNTIPLIGENSIKETDTNVKKRSPSSDIGRSRRVIREAETDQEAAASGGNGPDPADLSDIEAEDSERDKRYLPFSGEAQVSAGGGSGNFLFDIIRRTADGAARAAGTVYRMVAGTENLGIGLSATSTATRVYDASAVSQLIAGSGATEESDEKDNAAGAGGVAEIDVAKTADGYTEGIPGPITRLFVIANRGLANLVQDLILRLAQTSERIVNFKARLITALI